MWMKTPITTPLFSVSSVWESNPVLFFYPQDHSNFPQVCLCWWDEPGRGPSLDQTWPLTQQYITTLSCWRPPSFESLSPAPTLVHCHQTALDQSKRGLKGKGRWQLHSRAHVTRGPRERKGTCTEPLSTKTKIYLDGKSFELLTQR